MENEYPLNQRIEIGMEYKSVKLPDYIADNLRQSISLRPYQDEALKYFLFYIKDKKLRKYPAHLLFHMATGSGKTIIMAALIVYLYKQGYRNFLFFVNSSNIIKKTKENFLNSASSKYLFSDSIILDGTKINIREVENFDDAVADDINIHFTTIQGLHTRLAKPKENTITYEDFKNKKLVLIADEAHHINRATRRLSETRELDLNDSWEDTAQKIFNLNNDNLLLEFTATLDMDNENLKEKYKNKIVYNYPLKKFRQDGYSKEIELRQSFIEPVGRMFQAIIFSQYRRKLAGKNGLLIKPVVMMKSKTIQESKNNMQFFINLINSLAGSYIKESREKANEDIALKQKYDYFFNELKLTYDNFVLEIKEEFSTDKLINMNEDKDFQLNQVKVNSLEDYNNEIRVIFAVDKLNEGWDVLNLFDIVRLYETRSNNQTTQEAQLIGRGARYCPFVAPDNPEDEKEKRKYDKDMGNPLRSLEELYYHCAHDPKYIHEIKAELRNSGMIDDSQRKMLMVKDNFKQTELYNEGVIYVNRKIVNENMEKKSLMDYGIKQIYEYPNPITSAISEESVTENERRYSRYTGTGDWDSRTINIHEFDDAVLRRVADGIRYFCFDNIIKLLPHIKTMNKLFEEIKDMRVEVTGDRNKINKLTQKQKKDILHFVLSEIEHQLKSNSVTHIGSRKFVPCEIQDKIIDKDVLINDSNRLIELNRGKTFDGDWYVYTENLVNELEEKFIKYIKRKSEAISEVFSDFYLIRNEKAVKVYDFDNGRGFEPDFILLLLKNTNGTDKHKIVYQLFIEPKGGHLIEHDRWKEDFLLALQKEKMVVDLYKTNSYKIIGLPFFTEAGEKFKNEFEEIIRR